MSSCNVKHVIFPHLLIRQLNFSPKLTHVDDETALVFKSHEAFCFSLSSCVLSRHNRSINIIKLSPKGEVNSGGYVTGQIYI